MNLAVYVELDSLRAFSSLLKAVEAVPGCEFQSAWQVAFPRGVVAAPGSDGLDTFDGDIVMAAKGPNAAGYHPLRTDVYLTLEQTGLIVHMLRRPPGWRYSCERLAQELGESLYRIRRITRELAALGYIRTYNERDKSGRIGKVTEVRASLTLDWNHLSPGTNA